MISRRLALFLAMLVCVPLNARASSEIAKETVEVRGALRTYYLYVPPTAKVSGAPLIVLLHGSGQEGSYLVERWKDLADREGLVLLGPNSYHRDVWRLADDGPDFIRNLVERIETRCPIDTRRVYLFGYSGGAVYALTLSMLESEYFAATAIHAGAWRRPEEFDVIANATRKIPLAIYIGNVDEFFSLDAVRKTESALKDKGFPIEVTVIEHHHHWYDEVLPQINDDIWNFLKDRELDRDQRYIAYSNLPH